MDVILLPGEVQEAFVQRMPGFACAALFGVETRFSTWQPKSLEEFSSTIQRMFGCSFAARECEIQKTTAAMAEQTKKRLLFIVQRTGFQGTRYAIMSRTTLPCTSVNRKSRPE